MAMREAPAVSRAKVERLHSDSLRPPVTEAQIVARIERLPFSRWHVRTLMVIGTADFFEAFDSLTIAFVMPVLARTWNLHPAQLGFLISCGYIGQALGAVVLGWAAERYGRVQILRWTLALIAAMAIACALSWNYESLVWFRSIQGLALGAEFPLAQAYISELSKTSNRGRCSLTLNAIFGLGITFTSLASIWLIPRFGWQSMFILGAAPAALALGLRRLLPESPRWLAGKGRLDEADRLLAGIEREIEQTSGRPLPAVAATAPAPVSAPTTFRELFHGIYLRHTLSGWALMFCTSFVSYGLLTWIPTIFGTVFHLSIEQTLNYSFIVQSVSWLGTFASVFAIDFIRRRHYFLLGFLGGGLPLIALALLGQTISPIDVMVLVIAGRLFSNFCLTAINFYVSETYPTRMRALGVGTASAWMRIATIVGPTLVGIILSRADVSAVFMLFGGVGLIGALLTAIFMIETRGKVLEEIAR